MTLNFIQIILVLIVSFLAGMEGILDEFHFHQPVIACTLIGLVTGNLAPCLVLGGQLQMIALGWANIGAAVAPDAALASVASAIILVLGGQGTKGVSSAIAIAVPLAVAGLLLTTLVPWQLRSFISWTVLLKKVVSVKLISGNGSRSACRACGLRFLQA